MMNREFKLTERNGDYQLYSRYAYLKEADVVFTAWELIYDGDEMDVVETLIHLDCDCDDE